MPEVNTTAVSSEIDPTEVIAKLNFVPVYEMLIWRRLQDLMSEMRWIRATDLYEYEKALESVEEGIRAQIARLENEKFAIRWDSLS